LIEWIGFEVEEENEEKGVTYRYEMWVLKKSED
jgi:dihydrofolate reductase